MLRIDAHQHFWHYDPVRDSWITEEMTVIRRDFLPDDLQPILQQNNFDGCVVVQADQSEKENKYLLAYAEQYDFVKGVVGWADFFSNQIESQLENLRQYKKLKGFRTVLQGATPSDLMLLPTFRNGISKLSQFNFTYDILIYADQLKYIPAFVSAFPNQLFVIDHLAKPNIYKRDINSWAAEMQAVAQFENVYLKISGLVTEADWHNWRTEDFGPYLDVAVNAFGPNRIMFGSDWPVCLVAGKYEAMLGIVQEYFAAFSSEEQALFFGGNATRFYNLT
ncbi:MAG: amidohydrolase [Cytophagales bacterium CG18_big_fil_WC_8_21_14_2_50_42_9]|nr:MAG: amidohydrolase [Cytophagales bacterium CG18_big_fil_WC_8_21_14_2_50_42_9]